MPCSPVKCKQGKLVEQQVMDYIRVSFMVAGCTKLVPDRSFAKVVKAFACNDVLTTEELLHWF